YRLAAHLLLAITIFGCCLWFGNDLLDRPRLQLSAESRTFMTRALVVVGALLMIQIFWGALVAGLNAGFILNTFPLMNGSLLPPQGWSHDPVLINLFENLATVQWMHRLLATVLLLSGIALLLIIRRNPALASFQRWGAVLAGMIAVQYGLGILTLLSHVRIGLGVAHQLVALAIVGVLLTFLHQIRRSTPEPVSRTSSPRHS
ncbi:MAG: COX15/CtaA family protein, partial [Thermomicrobiales bacterium]|nr:COX15/CtaA family protein [Thermomicrobiales bacterium]